MLQPVFGPEVAAWVAARIAQVGAAERFGPHAAIGVSRGGALIAGAVFNNWRGHDIEVSFASADPRWARRGMVRTLFAYPFAQLGCARLSSLTAHGNARARKLLTGLGFTHEGVLRRGFDGAEDALIFGMLREECRWLEDSHGKRLATPAARP